MKWVSVGKRQLLETQTFRGNPCTTCNKNDIPGHSGRKEKQRKTKKGGEKILQYSRPRSMSARGDEMLKSCASGDFNAKRND